MSYELFLIRHAPAEERGADWPDDAKRPLTPRGIARARKLGRALVRLGVEFDVVLTSPLVRARQTAEAIASAYDLRPPIAVAEGLAPGASFEALAADLERQTRRSRIALVGHEPGIGELASNLAGLRRPLPFKKAAVCRIDADTFAHGAGTLRWFLTPKIVRAVARQQR
jgi:phosphohistidine phosphatase